MNEWFVAELTVDVLRLTMVHCRFGAFTLYVVDKGVISNFFHSFHLSILGEMRSQHFFGGVNKKISNIEDFDLFHDVVVHVLFWFGPINCDWMSLQVDEFRTLFLDPNLSFLIF